jgi:hypothetical protein
MNAIELIKIYWLKARPGYWIFWRSAFRVSYLPIRARLGKVWNEKKLKPRKFKRFGRSPDEYVLISS